MAKRAPDLNGTEWGIIEAYSEGSGMVSDIERRRRIMVQS